MSGHSKWATIHRQKEVKDAARGNLFSKLAKAITIAAKVGGSPDPEANYKLRVAVDKARACNMPKDNIERAISKASTQGDMFEVTYEGFGPGGIAVMVEAATDNKNRTAQEIKNIFERAGGRLGGPGAVSFNFEHKGLIVLKKKEDVQTQMLELIDLGVEDIEEDEEALDVYVEPTKLTEIKNKLTEQGFEITSADLVQRPKNYQTVAEGEDAVKALTFLDNLTEYEDVQKVYANLDVVKAGN